MDRVIACRAQGVLRTARNNTLFQFRDFFFSKKFNIFLFFFLKIKNLSVTVSVVHKCLQNSDSLYRPGVFTLGRANVNGKFGLIFTFDSSLTFWRRNYFFNFSTPCI